MSNAEAYRIEYLADYPQHIEACAAWCFGRWAVQSPEGSFAKTLSHFQQGTQKDDIPLTLIAISNNNNLPVGMGSLWLKDGEEWPDLSPWIAAVFVHYRHRNHDIASRLVMRLDEEAKRLGHDNVYLKTGSAAPLYEKNGYDRVEAIGSETTAAGQLILYKKAL